MWFVLQHEDHVSWNVCGSLVPLFGKRDFRALFPPLLYLHLQDFIFHPCRLPVRVQPFTRDLHFLCATRQNILQGHPQIVNHRGVLLLLYNTTVTAHASHTGAEGAREPAHSTAPHPKAGKRVVSVHVLIHASIAGTKELSEGVTSTEELFKDGMRVALEGIAKGARTATTCGASAF